MKVDDLEIVVTTTSSVEGKIIITHIYDVSTIPNVRALLVMK